ncbi:ABC transporter substrate-binding protein [Brevibacillus sp. NRS-1366]|uniref:ABC transporter substrate-binding protein n=1 Tax=Brevibacillus sp. NRS-1366 TaxID=3233899 RepID=UPI003D209403
MRKNVLINLGILLLSLTLAACGSAGTNSASPANVQASSENKADIRTYKHTFGETQIPVKPEKVVTLQYASQMLSVGVKPIGAASHLLENTGAEFQGIEDVGSLEAINYEKILSLAPDLIIAGDIDQDVYDKLSKIAPTVAVPWMDYDLFGHVKVIGEILNRQQEAVAWQAKFDEEIRAAKEKIIGKIGAGKTVAIYRVDAKEFYVYGARNMGFTLYKALGLTPPPAIQKEIEKDPSFWAAPISLEVLPDYAADYVFVTLFQQEEAKSRFNEIRSSALWKSLPAVINNHVYEINMDTWLGYTPHDIELQMQEAVKLLTQTP